MLPILTPKTTYGSRNISYLRTHAIIITLLNQQVIVARPPAKHDPLQNNIFSRDHFYLAVDYFFTSFELRGKRDLQQPTWNNLQVFRR